MPKTFAVTTNTHICAGARSLAAAFEAAGIRYLVAGGLAAVARTFHPDATAISRYGQPIQAPLHGLERD
jgi:hypothetical protein